MRTTWRRLALVLAVALAAACGGGGGDSGSGDGTASVPEPESAVIEESGPTLVEFADAVVSTVGADGALAAVLYALDDGYSLEQLVPAALDGDLLATGEIAGVEPDGEPYGLITPPQGPAGFARAPRASGSPPDDGPGETHSPDEVQALISAKLATLETVNLLGAPLGVGGEIGYEDVFGDAESEASPVAETTRDEATAMIGVLVGLVDLGYSFDQALEGWLFGDVVFAIGVDPTGETFTGVSVGGRPVAVCLTLRDRDGQVVAPVGDAPATMFGSATCANAIRSRTISYEGLEALRVDTGAADGSTGSPDGTDEADATTTSVADVTVFDGIYTADAIERDLGAIVEVLETIVEVGVGDGVVDGAMIQTSIVVYESTVAPGTYTKTEQATQTVLLLGQVDANGTISGEGNTSAEYVLLSCEPEDPCRGVSATQGAADVAVSFSGSIEGDTMKVEVVNSVSGATFTFDASR